MDIMATLCALRSRVIIQSWLRVSVVNKDLTLKAKAKDLTFKAKDLTLKAKAEDLTFKAKAKDLTSRTTSTGFLQFNLSVESNQNVESKRKSVESKNYKNVESKISMWNSTMRYDQI